MTLVVVSSSHNLLLTSASSYQIHSIFISELSENILPERNHGLFSCSFSFMDYPHLKITITAAEGFSEHSR